LNEVKEMKTNVGDILNSSYQLDAVSQNAILTSVNVQSPSGFFTRFFEEKKKLNSIRKTLKQNGFTRRDIRKVVGLVKQEMALNTRIERLEIMQKLFRYWHVAHLPFAIIMLVIVVVHVAITLAFGYKWIF
jgi:hypothetical protein